MRGAWLWGLALLLVGGACAPQSVPSPEQEAQRRQIEQLQERVEELSRRLDEQGERLERRARDTARELPPEAAQALERLRERLDDLTRRLEARLEAQSPDGEQHPPAASEPGGQTFDVAVAQFVLDASGFHGLDEQLNETQEVDPASLFPLRRAQKVLSVTPWPEELAGPVEAFLELLDVLIQAMEDDDGARAAELTSQAHGSQHDLSAQIDAWLGFGGHGHED